MPTNEERREVAARLRLLPDQRGIYSDRQFFELLDEKIFCLLDKALDNPRGFHTWVSNIFYLADLIEPEPERTVNLAEAVDAICGEMCGDGWDWRMRAEAVVRTIAEMCGAKVVDK